MRHFVYILKCSDGSYYTGVASDLDRRLREHQEGAASEAYTFRRRPVRLVWAEEVETRADARLHEQQIKGWSRAKKESLIRGDFEGLHQIVATERRKRERPA